MAIKINNTTVIDNNKRGTFSRINAGAFTADQLEQKIVVGSKVGDIVYNIDSKNLAYWDGEEWTGVGNITAEGGTVSTPGDGYVYHVFNHPGVIKEADTLEFNVINGGEMQVLAIGGGGGGGGADAGTPGSGGGGGGGVLSTLEISPGLHYVTVGGSGQRGSSNVSGTGGGVAGRSAAPDNRGGGGGGNAGPGGSSGGGGGGGSWTALQRGGPFTSVPGIDPSISRLVVGGGGAGGGGGNEGPANDVNAGGGGDDAYNTYRPSGNRGGGGNPYPGDGGGYGGAGGGFGNTTEGDGGGGGNGGNAPISGGQSWAPPDATNVYYAGQPGRTRSQGAAGGSGADGFLSENPDWSEFVPSTIANGGANSADGTPGILVIRYSETGGGGSGGGETLPITDGLVLWLEADSFYDEYGKWLDKSGTGNYAAVNGVSKATHTGPANGSEADSFDYLTGSTTSTVTIDSTNGGWTGGDYTLIHVTRYTGGTKGRIWDGKGVNWLSGHQSDGSGRFFHNGWMSSSSTDYYGNDWFLSMDQKSFVRTNKGEYEFTGGGGGIPPEGISINAGDHGGGAPSDWACAFVALYNRELTSTEYEAVENYAYRKFMDSGIEATGGSKYTPGDGYAYHVFTSPGTLNVTGGDNVEVLVVAGGGGGGGNYAGGGGGGAGGFLTDTIEVNSPVPIIVGNGGSGGDTTSQGGDSAFGSLTATGGGGGGFHAPGPVPTGGGPESPGKPGGSGGGARGGDNSWSGSGPGLGGDGIPGQGYPGGPVRNPVACAYCGQGGGGGGAGGAGSQSVNSKNGGPGGIGRTLAGWNIPTSYGTPGPTPGRWFAGGGGGDSRQDQSGTPGGCPGGAGGGGIGAGPGRPVATSGVTNTGGGGGGGGAPGGSGIVIVRYLI